MDEQTTPAGRRRRTPNARSSGLPTPPGNASDDVLWHQLESTFAHDDRSASRNRYGYQGLRLVALLVGATVTVLAAINAPPAVTASLAAVAVVAEGTQQLFQLHASWISYRTSAETLRQHALLYVANLGPYTDPATRRAHLADVLSDLMTKELGQWARTMRRGVGSGTR